jgi:hypothetical protein
MLTRIHDTMRKVITVRDSLAALEASGQPRLDRHGYAIDAALEVRARQLEYRVRGLRAGTTLSLDTSDQTFKQLVSDVDAFQKLPEHWYSLVLGLHRLEPIVKALAKAVTEKPNPALENLPNVILTVCERFFVTTGGVAEGRAYNLSHQ